MNYLLQNTNWVFLVIACTFLFCAFVQIIYYAVYSRLLFYKKKERSSSTEPVTIIICAKNEAEKLLKFLPGVLTQDYPEYEVVVVNDCSEDDTEIVLEQLMKDYPRLRTTYIKKDEKFTHGKKLALSVGIKSAKNELLLLTDADCFPETNKWLASMVNNFSEKTDIVLGYGGYMKSPGLINKLIRFDTVFIAMQYLSFALSGMPYMGVGRNLAYRKSLYFKNKGFASHSHLKSGDDDLFINEVGKSKNTSIEFRKESYTRSTPENSFFDWIFQKKRHLTTGNYYKPLHKFVLVLEPLTRILFYFSFAACLFYPPFVIYALGIFGFRLLIQYNVFLFLTMRTKEKDLLLFLPIFDFLILFINLNTVISNYFNKRARYQWTK